MAWRDGRGGCSRALTASGPEVGCNLVEMIIKGGIGGADLVRGWSEMISNLPAYVT